MNLQTISWNIQNWMTCESSNQNSCKTWNSGYTINKDNSSSNNLWIQNIKSDNSNSSANSTTENSTTTSQTVAGATAGVTVAFSFWNMSSPQGIWIAMNQFQLILLLLLTNSRIPKSIENYLSGMKATTCSLNFIPFKNIPFIKEFVNWLDYNLIDTNLDNFGIFSGSTFVNNFSLLCFIILIIFVHFWYWLLYKWFKNKVESRSRWTKILEIIYQLFSYTIYIRLILEANQFLILSSFQELRTWNIYGTSKIISLIISFIGAIFWISLIVISFFHWNHNKDLESIDHYMPFKELFNGLKNNRKPRLYSTALLLRRWYFCIYLIMGSKLESIYLVIPLIIAQTLYLSYLVIIRPYKQVKDNVLEITNEVYYFVMIILLSHFNSVTKWTEIAEKAYFYLILANSITTILIMLGNVFYCLNLLSLLLKTYLNKINLIETFSCNSN